MMTTPTKDVDFEAEMKSAFKVFDHDGSGTISLDELRRVMKSFGEILTEDELDAMIKEVDKNGDGSGNLFFVKGFVGDAALYSFLFLSVKALKLDGRF